MIKQQHYIQLLNVFEKIQQRLHFDNDMIEMLFELTCVHSKLQTELEYFRVYPNHDLSKAIDIAKTIKQICKQYEINVIFYKRDDDVFKQCDFASYYYKNVDITQLIVFKKIKNKERAKNIGAIDDNEFNDLEL